MTKKSGFSQSSSSFRHVNFSIGRRPSDVGIEIGKLNSHNRCDDQPIDPRSFYPSRQKGDEKWDMTVDRALRRLIMDHQ
jgi:hypothetical protein